MLLTYVVHLILHPELNGRAIVDAIRQAIAMAIPNLRGVDIRLGTLDNGDPSDVFVTVNPLVREDSVRESMQNIARITGVASVEGTGLFLLGPGASRPLVFTQTREQAVLDNRVGELEVDAERLNQTLRDAVHQIQYLDEPFNAPAAALSVDVLIGACDADGKVIAQAEVSSVQVDIDGAETTAPNAQIVHLTATSPVDGSLVVPITNGRVTVQVIATGTGSVRLKLTDVAASGLSVTDEADAVFTA